MYFLRTVPRLQESCERKTLDQRANKTRTNTEWREEERSFIERFRLQYILTCLTCSTCYHYLSVVGVFGLCLSHLKTLLTICILTVIIFVLFCGCWFVCNKFVCCMYQRVDQTTQTWCIYIYRFVMFVIYSLYFAFNVGVSRRSSHVPVKDSLNAVKYRWYFVFLL